MLRVALPPGRQDDVLELRYFEFGPRYFKLLYPLTIETPGWQSHPGLAISFKFLANRRGLGGSCVNRFYLGGASAIA